MEYPSLADGDVARIAAAVAGLIQPTTSSSNLLMTGAARQPDTLSRPNVSDSYEIL